MIQSLRQVTFDKVIEFLLYIFTIFLIRSIAGTQITLGLLIIVWLTKMIVKREFTIQKTGVELAFLVFIITLIISTIFSLEPQASFFHLKNMLLITVVYIVFNNIHQKPTLVRVIDLFIIVSVIIAIWGLLSTDFMGGKRVAAFKSTTMTWGAMSTIFTIVTLSLALFSGLGRKQLLYGVAFLIQFTSLIFSWVRGAWVALVVGIIILSFVKNKKLIFGLLIFLLIVFFLAPTHIKHRISHIADLSVNSTNVRLVQWKHSLEIIRDYPIVGVGWIDLGELIRSYAPEGTDISYHSYQIGHFHNNFIMFFVYFGLLGFMAGCYLIFRILQVMIKIYRKIPVDEGWLSALSLGCIAAFVSFWINGLFDWTFGDAEPATMMWFIVGISLVIGKLMEENHPKATL